MDSPHVSGVLVIWNRERGHARGGQSWRQAGAFRRTQAGAGLGSVKVAALPGVVLGLPRDPWPSSPPPHPDTACSYLYKTTSPGVQDYLCNRLYTLPEKEVEHYLSQFTQLCMIRPNSSLERVLIDLCSRSLRIAVKVPHSLAAAGLCCGRGGSVLGLDR